MHKYRGLLGSFYVPIFPFSFSSTFPGFFAFKAVGEESFAAGNGCGANSGTVSSVRGGRGEETTLEEVVPTDAAIERGS